jgi:hypothetical protein
VDESGKVPKAMKIQITFRKQADEAGPAFARPDNERVAVAQGRHDGGSVN